MELNRKLSELTGVILGDGHLHKKSNCITIVGSLEDIYYYKNRVIPLFEELFNMKPKLRRRNDRNAYYLHLENKKVFEFLTKEVGLVRGNKTNAKIPRFVLNDKKMKKCFLRGLYDTDGCLKFSKQTKEINYYPRVQFDFKKSNFAHQIGNILNKVDFKYGKWEENINNELVFYHISGNDNLERWFRIIKPKNPVHISKYLFWKKFGHYIPKSTLNERLKALNLNIGDISK